MTSIELGEQRIDAFNQSDSDLLDLSGLRLSAEELTHLISRLNNTYTIKNLNLSNNKLQSLPDSILGLFRLEILNIESNEITSVPKSIEELRHVKTLNVKGNPLSLKSLVALSKMRNDNLFTRNDTSNKNSSGFSDTDFDTLLYLRNNEQIRAIIPRVLELFPDLSFQEIKDLIKSLTEDQKEAIIQLDLPLIEVGIGQGPDLKLVGSLKIEVSLPKMIEFANEIRRNTIYSKLDLSKSDLTAKELGLLIPFLINTFDQSSIQKLILKNTALVTLPDNLSSFSHLESLYISGKNFTSLPDSIGNLPKLSVLSVTNTSIRGLPDSIDAIKTLTELYVYGNKDLSSLPESIGELPLLTKLDLSRTGVRKLPDSKDKFPKLETLVLNGNKQLRLAGIQDFTMLRNLHVEKMGLENLEFIKDHPDLIELNLKGNKLTNLDSREAKFPKLKTLDLQNNKLSLIDPMLDLPILETLNLSGNKITTIYLLNSLEALENLYLSKNELIHLEIENSAKDLVLLDLSRNSLNEVPLCIQSFYSLRTLLLNGNNITDLSSSATFLSGLCSLEMSSNKFNSLLGISQIAGLITNLDVSNSGITSYKGLEKVSGIHSLNIEGNLIDLKALLVLSAIDADTIVGLRDNEQRLVSRIRRSVQDSSGDFRDIVASVEKTYPNTSVEDLETLFLRLSTDQVRGIVEFKLPLCQLGIGLDPNNVLSHELNVDPPLPERFRIPDEIRKPLGITSETAIRLAETKTEYIQAMLDFGLSEAQLDRVTDLKINWETICEQILIKIKEKNYPDDKEEIGYEKIDLGELTEKDKKVAILAFNEMYPPPKINEMEFAQRDLPNNVLSRLESDTSLDGKPVGKDQKEVTIESDGQEKESVTNDTEQLEQPTLRVSTAASLPTHRSASTDDLFAMSIPQNMASSRLGSNPDVAKTISGKKRKGNDPQRTGKVFKR